MSLLDHLVELRGRLLRAILGFIVVLIPFAIFARSLYHVLAEPLLRLLPKGSSMIATEVASPFFAPLKLAAVVSFCVALPWILYQLWAFVAPGLYRNERKLVAPLLFSSTMLFYLGVSFAYFFVLPRMFHFFLMVAPQGVEMMTDINAYLSFVLKLFLAFGFAFETPVAIVLLCWTGFVTPEQLAKRRDYVLVGVFVIAAVITPPDVLSQCLLAASTYALFELGLIWARWVLKMKRSDAETDRDQPPAER